MRKRISVERFSISLVYQKRDGSQLEHALRAVLLEANNEDEALGKAINYLSDEFENWMLMLKVIIKIES